MVQLILFVAAIVVFLLATFIPSVPRFNLIAFGLALATAAVAWPQLAG